MMLQHVEGRYDAFTPVEDPVAPDDPSDARVDTTRRGLARVAAVAVEVATRFSRDGVSDDPLTWMTTPRRLFGGGAALDACLDRAPFARAMLLHALCVRMDARPEEVDAIRDGVDGPDAPRGPFEGLGPEVDGDPGGGWWEGSDGEGGGVRRPGARRLRLYSAMVVVARGGELAHLFHASVASSASVVRERIRARFGAAPAAQADIRLGVDLECPATTGMLPPAFREMLDRGRRVRWSAMAGFDVTVEHRIPS